MTGGGKIVSRLTTEAKRPENEKAQSVFLAVQGDGVICLDPANNFLSFPFKKKKKLNHVLFACLALKGHISRSPLHPVHTRSNFTSVSLSYLLRSLCPGSLSDLAESKAPCCCNSFFTRVFALRLQLAKTSAYKPRSRLFERPRLSCLTAAPPSLMIDLRSLPSR